MLHLLAFSAATGGAVTDSQIAAVTDPVFSQRSNAFWLPKDYDLLWATGMGATILSARMNSPSLRLPSFPYIDVGAALIPPSPLNLTSWRNNPFRLRGEEGLQADASDSANERVTVLCGISDGLQPVPSGNVFRLRGASTTAVVANAWSTIEPVTYTNTLPQGTYSLVGLYHQSANGQAARVVFGAPSNNILRPGCVSVTAVGGIRHPLFGMGQLGEWGRFTVDNVPQIEVLANAANAAHTVYLDLIKVA